MHPLSWIRTALLATAALSSPAHANDIALTAEQIGQLNIEVAPVKRATSETIAIFAGTIVPPVNSRIVATAPFAGTITQLHVLPGQRVSKGTPLATVSSREFLETQTELSKAEAELQIAQAIAKRKHALVDKNFQSPIVAEEADGQVAKIEAVIARHRRTLALQNIIAGTGGEYSVTAASDGIIVATSVMPGDKIEAMAPAVALDTSDKLWIEIQVPGRLVPAIKPADIVKVAGGPQGHVISIGPALDGLSRSAILYAELPANSDLLCGQLVSVTIERATDAAVLAVPRAAITRIGDKHTVFVRSQTGFTSKTVVLRGQSPETATVSGDLAPQMLVAASGLPQLEQLLPEN